MKRKGLKLRKWLAVMMALCMAVGILAVPGGNVVVEAAEKGGFEDQDFTYKIRLGYDNEIEITGYQGNDTEIVIPNLIDGKTVSCIGFEAFKDCTGLKKVIMQEGVIRIDTSAFSGCSNLDSIIIPKTVTAIGNGAFHGCSSLSNITIPENVTILGSGVFRNCSSLTSITIPENVTEIGEWAFKDCSGLQNIILPSKLTNIAKYTFHGCSSLSDITIPEGVTSIGDWAFYGCSSLRNIVIPSNITSIGSRAFQDCVNLTDITIPEGVTRIESSLFVDCSSLSSVEIPKSVTSIGDAAFLGCCSLKNIEIPENVTSIEWGAFGSCTSLTSITIPHKVTKIEFGTFSCCKNLSSVTILGNVNSIGFEAFYGCSSLNSIIIPEGVTNLEKGTFQGCSSLKSITMSEGITSLGDSVFEECSSLSNIIIPKTVTSIGNRAFNNCTSLLGIKIPEGVTSIGEYTFHGCKNLREIILPESLTDIGAQAFAHCNSLNTIIIPQNVISIGDWAFVSCTNLSDIIIPENINNIGEKAFYLCHSVRKINNYSAIIIDLSDLDLDTKEYQWYNTATGEPIDKLGTGTAVALPKPTELKKSDITLDDGSYFVDKHGNKVDTDNVIIVKSSITQKQEDIIQAVEEITQNAAEKSRVFYYDISAYINAIGGEPAVLSGNITIKLDYPSGVTKDHDIVVLHNTSRLEDVKKYDSYFTFETDGFSPFTVIALEAGKPSDNTAVRDFVNRLYTLVLAREAEEAGLESWTNALVTGESSGVDAGYGFVFSDECKQKNLSNDDFVEILYNTFMNRPSDEGGKTAWVSQLDAGVEREKVFEGFIYSAEFADICADYGISVGSISDVGALVNALSHYRNQNADITKFVARCYTEAMGRDYEPDGLEAWCKVIIEKSNTPKQVAQNFIFSEEFTLKNLSDEEYVQVLYRTFMGREADEGGLAAWVNVLESGREDRAKVLEGFSDSVEFDGILQSFGLN